jgi:tetratricopeptide (TPR) repeat protein
MGIARGGGGGGGPSRRDSIDDFDPRELIGGRVAHGSPAPGKPPSRPAAGSGGFGSDELDLEFEPSPSQATRQMSPDQASALASLEGDEDEEVLAGRPGWNRGYNGDAIHKAVDRQLDDAALGDDIDQEVAAELGSSTGPGGEDLPFDPDEARAFDQGVHGDGTDAIDVSGFEETAMPRHPAQLDTPSYEEAAELAVSGSYDPYSTDAAHEQTSMSNDIVEVDESDIDQPRAESTVEDELDEADFYASQGMYPEALDVLRGLQQRYPHHPLVSSKTREMELQVHGGAATPPAGNNGGHDAAEETSGTEALDIDEIEEMDDFEVVEDSKAKRKPSVMLERPVDEGDAETHYDLGLAYKEMGLYDEAIKAFEKVLRSPNREVQCRVMLGMCQREMGNPSEAINHFKQGLHCDPSERERLSLYYEIGMTYEAIGDEGEALYYFEAVIKRDPSFADAIHRADALRARVGHATPPPDDDDL